MEAQRLIDDARDAAANSYSPYSHYRVGAVVVTRSRFEELSPSAQEIVKESCDRHFARLAEATAREGEESIRVLDEKGIAIIPLAKADQEGFQKIGRAIREELAGDLFPQTLLDRVLQVLEEHRASPKASAG